MSFGLVLSGGAAFGLANAGVLQVFEEHGKKPDVIAGSSMGAIIAALYATGHDAKTICALATQLTPLSVVQFSDNPLDGGLHGGILQQQLEKHLGDLIGDRTIGETVIPFVCVAGKVKQPIIWSRALSAGFLDDLLSSVEPYIFPPETRILDAIAASSALPIIFSPVSIHGEQFIDLCAFGAVPSRSLLKTHPVDTLIATHTTPNFAHMKGFMPAGIRAFIDGAQQSLRESLDICDCVIAPKLSGTMFDFHKGEELIEAGKSEAEKQWHTIENMI